MLPLLAESLENGNLLPLGEPGASEAALKEFASIRSDLASYALNGGDVRSRSAAAACLFSYIVHLTKHDAQECPAKKLLEDVVMPALLDASRDLGQKATARETVVDCLNLSSVLVSLSSSRWRRLCDVF